MHNRSIRVDSHSLSLSLYLTLLWFVVYSDRFYKFNHNDQANGMIQYENMSKYKYKSYLKINAFSLLITNLVAFHSQCEIYRKFCGRNCWKNSCNCHIKPVHHGFVRTRIKP